MPRRALGVWLAVLLLAAFCRCGMGADLPAADLRTYVRGITGAGDDRSAGSAAAGRDADYLAGQLERLTHRPVRRQPFLLALPVVEKCAAVDETPGGGGSAVPLWPLLPSGGQPAALAARRDVAEVLYAGRGTLEELRGKNLAGRFVALDAGSQALAWQTAASLGARGILFLGDAKTTTSELLNKATNLPVGIPRFYCDDAAAVEGIKTGAIRSLKIDVRIHWRERRLENLLCFVPGALGGMGGGQQYVVVQARYDASSQVMGRAPGAEQAASAGVLLDLAGKAASVRDHVPVLFVLTAGDAWNFHGTRAALDLLDPEAKDASAADADLQRQLDDVNARLKNAGEISEVVDRAAAGNFSALSSALGRDEIENQLLRESSRIEDQLERARAAASPDEKTISLLQSQREALRSATTVLSPGAGKSSAQRSLIQTAARVLSPLWQAEARRLAELRDAMRPWRQIRGEIGSRSPMLFASLALTSGSSRYGFFARSDYNPALDCTGKSFAQCFRRYAPVDPAFIESGFVPESTEKRFTLQTFFSVKVGFASDAALARGIPAGAFASVQDPCLTLDTPNDTAARLNFANLEAQERSLSTLLINGENGALTDPAFYVRGELSDLTADQDVTVFERAVGESLPRLRAADCLLGGEVEVADQPALPMLVGTRRQDWLLTHADGTATFTSALQIGRTRLSAFQFDGGGRISQALAGNVADVGGLAEDFYPDPDRPIRCMVFESRRLDCYGLFDPRYLDLLDKIDVLDARRLDRAQYSNVYTAGGAATVFLPPDIRWQLLLARGALSNRMLLINADAEHPSGIGFDTTDLEKLGPLAWRNVLDLDALNGQRQRDLQKFGISSQVVIEMQAAAQKRIAAAREAEKSHDYPAFFAATDAAWSLQSQIYQTLIDTSNGIIKGVIFLLLGIIPFSYFLERLLIAATTIYRQIAGFVVIFAAMTGALWFHPAFRISSAPLMILLAFLILILSSAVVYILWGKFEEEIARIRGSASGGGGGAAHSTSLRRGAVMGAAVRLGLSNMRRRGTRTALTLLTLILLTFTLLCFTSVTESVQITPRLIKFPANLPAPPPGILVRQRAWRTLPAETRRLARGLALPGPGVIATRWWYASQQSEEPWMLPVRRNFRSPPDGARRPGQPPAISQAGGGSTFYASALLGLDPTEGQFQPVAIDSVLPQFDSLGQRSDICWLPIEAHRSLAFNVGDAVNILGHSLRVAGFFDESSFDKLRELTGDPLSPVDPAGGVQSSNGLAGEMQAAAPEASYRYLAANNLAIVPASLVQQIGGRMTSIMVRPADASRKPAKALFAKAEDFARQGAFTVYVSDGSKVRSINASMNSEPRDFQAVLIPMLIAGVIILNTMLGAVSDRTREIHVYTSIGLAPSHVGMLFLAEAAALGTIGVVSGYIFGQGLATILSHTHLLPGVDLNYSSLSAIVTMGLVLGLVMLSALWPARAASRVAAPSLDRKWKLPKPIGDVLYVELPFTVNETAARGVVAFIEEFLTTTTQTGGRFTADAIRFFQQNNSAGAVVRGLTARVWLAPFDLGVIQNIRLAIHPTQQHNIFEVHLELTREAGNPGTWRRLNHPFLVEMRKQFLLWRNLNAEQIAGYVDKSVALYTRPVDGPPRSL